MKSEIIEKPEIKKEKPFPKLMISRNTGNVVLFHEPRHGHIVLPGEGNLQYNVGDYSSCLEMSNFIDFDKAVVLYNGD